MQMKTNFLVALAAMVVAPALFTGCGGPECGTGTTEQDGMCVPTAAPVTCDENTELSDGKCVSTVEEVTCAAGTELANGECVLAAGGCGEGTSFVDGACVADDPDLSQACATGTSYDSAAGACVADFTVVCGANTVAQDGACVPDSASLCATGTMVDADGVCVIAAAACGENTILDPNSNTCLVNDANVFCGANTAYDADSETCVPTSSVCDAGTTFDDMTGLCLPDATCQAGDVILDGVCVSPAREAFANADLATDEAADRVANNDDPQTGGTATPLTLPAMGTEYRVSGTVNAPIDLDGNGSLDQDIDSYSFTATAGQTFKVAVQPVAGPPVSFVVRNESGDYVRFSTLGLAPGSARQILLPEAGTYTVYVTSAVAISDDVAPIGDDTWDYVLSMEEIAGPTSTDVDTTVNDITGEFGNLGDNLYKLTNFTGGELVNFTVDSLGANVERGVMQVWAGPTQYMGSYEVSQGDIVSVALPSPDAYVFFDWIRVNGPDTSFSVSASALPNQESFGALAAGTGEATSQPLTQVNDDARYVSFSLAAGEVAEISHTNDENGTVELYVQGPGGMQLFSDTSFSASGATSPEYAYVYAPNGGSFVVRSVANGDRTNGTLTVKSITPANAGSFGAGDQIAISNDSALTTKKRSFNLVTLTENVSAVGSLLGKGGETTGDLFIIDAVTGQQLADVSSNTNTLDFIALPAGTHLFVVEAETSTAYPTGYDLTLDLTPAPNLEVEPNDSIATATPVSLPGRILGTGGYGSPREWVDSTGTAILDVPFDYFSFTLPQDLTADQSLVVALTNAATASASTYPDFTIFDSTGAPIAPKGDIGDTIELDSLTAGTYYVGISVDFNTSFDTAYFLDLVIRTTTTENLGAAAPAGSSSTPLALLNGDALSVTFDVNAGEFFEVIQDNDQAAPVDLALSSGTSNSTFDAQSSTDADRSYGFAEMAETITADVTTSTDLTNLVVTARSIVPTNLNTKNPGETITLTSAVAVPRETREFYSVTLAADATLTGSIVSNATNDADLFILDPTDGSVIESITSGKDTIAVPLAAGTYVLVVEADGSELATGYTVDLSVDAPPVTLDGTTGDTCMDAIPVTMSGTYSYTGDMANFSADYGDSNSCTGFTSNGRDVVFRVTLNDGQTLNASLDGSSDFTIWLVTDCTMAGATCVAGQDNGNPEEIVNYTNTTGATVDYFLIADRYLSSTTAQPFSLNITVQ